MELDYIIRSRCNLIGDFGMEILSQKDVVFQQHKWVVTSLSKGDVTTDAFA